ncbi:growth arrest and DNA damage-inducible proteins-interacting protein 1-like [Pecten maximus]|uniref:growth arrest and DNA damage-inducible proteins-interacting protein 1-like n=1 Tax=Pecten maximus TaxID=6579 RepID=UPI001458FD4D|nr:growth arrest and DNA damage-inducible proteins-interacting protein 1-like [Pecten maximus]
MAASMVRCWISSNNSKLVKRLVLCGRNGNCNRSYSATQTPKDTTDDIHAENTTEDGYLEDASVEDWSLDPEDDVTRIRDVSRLGPRLKQRLRKERPSIDRDFKLTKDYSRKLYGKMGSASGVNPQILWPNLDELRDRIEFEKRFEPTFEANMKKIQKWDERREKKLQARLQNVEKAMAKMPNLIKQYHLKLETAKKQADAEQEKLDQLNREATEIYGPMKRTDYRLKDYISTRLKEERRAEKQAKMEERQLKKQQKASKEKAEEGKATEEIKSAEEKVAEGM